MISETLQEAFFANQNIMIVGEFQAFGANTLELTILCQIVEELKIKPTCEKILSVVEKEPRLVDRPELLQMYASQLHVAFWIIPMRSLGWCKLP